MIYFITNKKQCLNKGIQSMFSLMGEDSLQSSICSIWYMTCTEKSFSGLDSVCNDIQILFEFTIKTLEPQCFFFLWFVFISTPFKVIFLFLLDIISKQEQQTPVKFHKVESEEGRVYACLFTTSPR